VYVDNVRLCDEQFISMGCKPNLLFRPPYGRIRPNQTKSLSQYKIVMWDVLSLDYQESGKNESHLQGTIDATRSGSIVVFHDSFKAEKKLKYILPRFLEHFSGQGFQFKSL
jgi:peptidoglycan/xylan/chitin deacetylase (PgdA/CDA1 family)